MNSDAQAGARPGPAPPAITKPPQASVGLTGDLLPPFMPGRPPLAAATAGPAVAAPAVAEPAESGALSEWDAGDEERHEFARGADDERTGEHTGDEEIGKPSRFPLDAFFVPPGADHAPSGYDESAQRELSDRVGSVLEAMARQIRARGIASLDEPGGDELARLVAAAVAAYYSRRD